MRTIAYSLCTIFCFLVVFFSAEGQSSKSKKLYKDAFSEYASGNHVKSLDLCLQAIEHESDYTEAQLLTAKNYYELLDFANAIKTIDQIDQGNEDALFLEAITYKSLGEYEKAIEKLDSYIANARLVNQQQRAKIEKEGALLAIQSLKENDTNFAFENLSNPVNTTSDEYAVTFVDSPKKILISRNLQNEYKEGENIKYISTPAWMMVNDGDEFEFLNTPAYEGSGVFDRSHETFYFTKRTEQSNKKQIYFSIKVDGIWQQAKPVNETINMPGSNSMDPMLSYDGDTLFYSSDRRGGLGGYDIWFSIKNDEGIWSDAINIGAPINTPEDEVAPFSNSDGTFYFSSEGHAGFGKLDIYYTNGLNGKREINNLGSPFNSPLDDSHIALSDNRGFLASNRAGGSGGYDIYTFEQQVKATAPIAADQVDDDKIIYSVIFASRLYETDRKFIKDDYATYQSLSPSEITEIENQVEEALTTLSRKEKSKIKEDDKILLASLDNGRKNFIERFVAGIYESKNTDVLPMSEEDRETYDSMKPEEKREVYRMGYTMYHDLNEQFSEKSDVAAEEETDVEGHVAEMTPVSETGEGENEISQETEPVPAATRAAIEQQLHQKAPTDQLTTQNSDEKFTNLLGVEQSVRFYQELPFRDKKRVDRIMAIRLVNEKYVLAPELNNSDRSYFHSMSNNEKAIVERLKMYFRSWNKDQELSNLRESDLNYLSSLDPHKRAKIARIIVRRGIGVDNDNFVRFAGPDWSEYKSYSEREIQNIKEVASLLRSNDQMFDVALAYAGHDYQLNNNLAALKAKSSAPAMEMSTDPEVPTDGPEQLYESVYFDPGAYRLRKEAMIALNDLVNVYRSNPQILIGLRAYSGDLETNADNVQLSSRRIRSAKSYLIDQGVPDIKIQSEPKSISQSINLHELSGLEARKLEISLINFNAPTQSDYTAYLIQPGNTLYSLAKANNISVEELKSLNGLSSNLIIAYQPLRVKKTATLNPEYMVAPSTHLVYDDDQPEPEQAEPSATANQSPENEGKERGEETMVFDVTKDVEPEEIIHIVQKGEKMEDIAKRYEVEVQEIVEWNELKREKVKKGQKLKIMQ